MNESNGISEADLWVLEAMFYEEIHAEWEDMLDEAVRCSDPLEEHREREALLPAFLDGGR